MSNKFEEKDFSEDGFNLSMWKKILLVFKPFYKYVFILFVFNILIAVSEIVLPIMNKKGLDEFTNHTLTTDSQLLIYVVIYLLIILITAFLHFYFFVVAGKCEMEFSHDLRMKLFKKLQGLSFAYYDVTPTGWLVSRVSSDVARLAEIISWSFAEIFWGVPMMIGLTGVMLYYNWKLAILVLLVVPLIAVATFYFQKRILRAYREVRKTNSIITNAYSEGINGAKTTKTLVLENNNLSEFKTLTHNYYDAYLKAEGLSAIFRPMVEFISSFAVSLVLWIGGSMVFDNMLSFGILYIFVQYAKQFFEPIRTISMIFQDFQMAQASGERIVYLLECEPTVFDSEEVLKKYGTVFEPKSEVYEDIKGDIEFRNVDFHYIEDEPVLKNFNLQVKAGQTIALVGETGSGKSTIVNLLCRFYEPVGGELLIDGVDYRKRSLGWLHSKLGYVLQAPHLFSGTIMDNIRFGRLDASDEEVIEAAKLVNAHDFIMNFKDAYQTDVGEGGSRLSTGQKQLISFARAVLANPAIFVLDEATASIDTETEQIIQYGIEHIMKGKTSFVVAHRLSTIVNSDRILVIDKGRIIEDGNHSQLMALRGRYYKLFTNQFKENLNNMSFSDMT